ncbi:MULTISPECIES: hypothetical protein [unclassified Microbacterium]|nr:MULTISPECIES: hypothetical protein [unclassified Microbacterium]MCR2785059.1 hypothetical protein [Microbacterium sp. zg.B96]MDL5352428.1 hypothetical protein [Microbacterium sp. zg-YB36]WIM16594.1 hypothetical protein QNO11_02845 [Microbacterium sp. zg-B96]
MDSDISRPSQAEGDDPDRPSEGTDDAIGHPSQAEGDDPDPQADDSV